MVQQACLNIDMLSSIYLFIALTSRSRDRSEVYHMPQECLGQISIVPYLLASSEALANCPAMRFEMWISCIFFTSSIVQTVLLLKLDQLMICRSVDARWLDYQRVWRSSDQTDGRTAAASQYAIHTQAILIDITVMFLWRISPWLLQSQWFDMCQKSTSKKWFSLA